MFLEVFALAQSLRALLLTTMSEGPLTPSEYAFYSVVFEAEAITPTEMGRRLAAPKTTVMEWVRVMEERGHARRVPDPRDGRSYRLLLTASGLTAHKRAHDQFEVARRAFSDAFGAGEAKAAARLRHIRVAITTAEHALSGDRVAARRMKR